jgi:hypothetical protein
LYPPENIHTQVLFTAKGERKMVIFFRDYIRVREDSSTTKTLYPLNSAPGFS